MASREPDQPSSSDHLAIDLCLLGAHNDLRGYETGRYRDENSLPLQVEQRWKFSDRWGLVGYSGVGGIGSNVGEALGLKPLASAGAGLRFQASDEPRHRRRVQPLLPHRRSILIARPASPR